jgi:hypothetical protein
MNFDNEPEIRKIRDDFYCSMFENVIEDQILLNYAQEVVARASKLSVRSVTPYTKSQVNFLNGNQFFGDINECRMKGNGRYFWADDMSLYEGDFKRPNVIEGQGAFKFRNNEKQTGSSKYCGSFIDGMYHGKGQLTNYFFKYNGSFESNKMQGKGTIKSGIESFEGSFKMDKKVCGKRNYTEGVFIGDFHDNETRKFGTYEFENGDKYCGSFNSGLFDGFGEYTWSCENGMEAKYIGQWQENLRDGLGTLKVDGVVCTTTFRKNIKDGPALVWAKNGIIYASSKMFQNDEFLGSKEIEISQENVEIIRKLLQTENLNVENFGAMISSLIKTNGRDIDDYPLHIPWFELKVEHSSIWDFARSFPNTEAKQEFSSLTQTIKEHSIIFQEIYRRYSEFSSKAVGKSGVKMTRVGLWQLMRDLELYKKSSLFNIQNLLSTAERDFNILCINPHDPFEQVPIASLVQYLMYTTLHMNKHHDYVVSCAINQRSKIFGLFATMFVIFLREFLCPIMSMQLFNGTIPKLIQDDRNFFTNFLNLISLKDQKLSIRSVFKIVKLWKCFGRTKGEVIGK